MKKNVEISIHYLALLLLIFLVIILKVGNFHMRWWDESMFAVNTYEMIQNGKWFSFYFNNAPDLFNSKPPLTIWLQILFVKIGGYNETALRLPSAIAAGLSIILLFRFTTKHFNYLWAWISALILLTSYGFIHFHTARTAEADSLLTLFILIANLYFIKFILSKSKINIWLFFLFITLAFATKLYAALLFIPAYLFILIYKRLFKQFTFSWPFLFGSLFFIITMGSLLYLREIDTPGYLYEIFYKDAARISVVVENHKQTTLFYLDNLMTSRFSIWFVFVGLGIILSFFKAKGNRKSILLMFLFFIISYLTIIMISTTKLEWYDMPLFPYLAVIAAYPIYQVIQNIEANNKTLTPLLRYSILAVLFFLPFQMMFYKSQDNAMGPGEKKLEANEMFLFQKIKNNNTLDGIKIYSKNWKGSLLFYKYRLAERDQHIDLVTDLSQITLSDKILVSDEKLKIELSNSYEITRIDHINNADLFYIEDIK